MNILNIIICAFAILGALDRLLDNRLGLGQEFERGFHLFGSLALSMIGMIVMVPLLAQWIQPVLSFLHTTLGIEPSIIPATLIANDMGGAALSCQVALDPELGLFNGLVVSCMMGGTISWTIPVSMTAVPKAQHRELLLGMLCGIITIPVGCLFAGFATPIPFGTLFVNLLPLILVSIILAIGLALCPDFCTKVFRGLGFVVKALITAGLVLSILEYFTGIVLVPGLNSLEDAAAVSLSCSFFLTGVLPMLTLLSKLISRPMARLSKVLDMNSESALGFIATLASGVTTFAMMEKMDKKGVMLNAAFAISAAFAFSDHLAFTMAFEKAYVLPMVLAKLIGGVTAVLIACLLYRKLDRNS